MIRIEPADASFFIWIEQGDFSFTVEHVFVPCFDGAVTDHLAPVERYRKTYGSDPEEYRDALADSQRALPRARQAGRVTCWSAKTGMAMHGSMTWASTRAIAARASPGY